MCGQWSEPVWEGGREGPAVPLREHSGLETSRNTSTALVVVLGENLPCGSESPRGQSPSSAMLKVLVLGSSSPETLSVRGLLSKHSLVSAGWLQAKGSDCPVWKWWELCCSPFEFWEKRQSEYFLLNQHTCRTEHGAPAFRPEEGDARHAAAGKREKSFGSFKNVEHSRFCLLQLCPQNQADGSLLPSWSWEELCSLVPWVLSCRGGQMEDTWSSKGINWKWFCGDTQHTKAEPGCPVMCQLSRASRPQPCFQLLAPCPSCCIVQPWAGQSWEHCLVVSTDELLLSFLLEWEGSAAGVEEKGCPGPFLCGGAQPLPRLPEINFYLGWFKISPLNDAPVIDHTELQLEDFIRFA